MKIKINFIIVLVFATISFSQVRMVSISNTSQRVGDYNRWLLGENALAIRDGMLETESGITLSVHDGSIINYYDGYLVTNELNAGQLTFNIYTDEGEEVTSIAKSWNIDMPLPAIQISEQDKRIYSVEIDGMVYCYSLSGELLWEKNYVEDYNFTYENTYFCKVLNRSNDIILTWSYPSTENDGLFKTKIIIVNKDGEILNERNDSNSIIMNIETNRQSGIFALSQSNTPGSNTKIKPTITIVDEQFNELWQDVGTFRKAGFLNNRYGFILQKDRIQIVNLQSGKNIYSYQIKNQQNIYDSAVISENRLIAISGIPSYDSGKLYFKNPNIELHSFPEKQAIIEPLGQISYLPDALSTDKNGTVLIGTKQGLFRIEE